MSRSIRRRTLLAAALPAVVAAVALPSAATASPHNFTFVRGAPDGALQINATTGNSNLPAANNNVSVRVAGGSLRVVDSGDDVVADGSVCVKLSVHEASCQLSQIARIEASLDHDFEQGGDDAWRSATSLSTTVRGGDGKDTYIRGLSPFVSRVEFQGGTGTDEASYVLADRGVLVTKDERANDGRPGLDFDNVRSDVERLVGSAHGDSLNGNSGSVTEFFQGGLGNDLLFGNGGPDVFESSAAADGADKMTGGPGIDQVSYAGRTRPVNATLNFDGADDGEAGEGDELVGSNEVIVGGRAGDTIRAPAGSTAAHFLHGLGGIDTLEGADGPDEITGGARGDTLLGNGGDDRIFANDGEADVVGCGEGAADTAQLDNRDGFESCEIRPAVGTLRLAPRTVVAEAGEPVRLRLSWRHPQAWRKLRTIELQLTQDRMPVGEITIRPRSERITDDGAVKLVRRATRLTRKGKTVAARLALRLDDSLAGQTLQADVEATDRRGRRQLERDAAPVRVAD